LLDACFQLGYSLGARGVFLPWVAGGSLRLSQLLKESSQKSDGDVKIVLSTPQLPAFARTRLIRETIPS
jgi:hypothetical protein